jgi:acyl-CoA reductase-like NAD-dependent aldehyde dehydrogenase
VNPLKNYIGGVWCDSASDGCLEQVNPSTEDVIALVPVGSPTDVDDAVRAAVGAAGSWAARSLDSRLSLLEKLADAVEAHAAELGAIDRAEMGRPMAMAEPSVRGAAAGFRKELELAKQYPFETHEGNTTVQRRPLGVVALITPWNFSTAIIFRDIAPALAAGNTLVVKPSEKTALSAVRLFELLDLPDGVLNLVLGDGRAGAPLSAHPDIDLVIFTGSVATGQAIAAAGATHLRRAVLELGGKDPVVIDADVDVDAVAKDVARGAFSNTGQICTSIERIYVHEQIAAEFVPALVEHARNFTHGDPTSGAAMGPMVDRRQRDIVVAHVEDAIRRGATVHVGGTIPDKVGFFYPATVLTDVSDDMLIMREETFGPVAPVHVVSSFQDGLERARSSVFGLGATVYTNNPAHAEAARDLPAALIFINQWAGPGSNMIYEPAGQSGVSPTGHTASFDAVTRPASVVRNSVA